MGPRRLLADPVLFFAALALSLYGVAMVYSAGQTDVSTSATLAWQAQLRWLVLGVAAAFIVSRGTVRFIEYVTVPAYLGSLVLLLLTLRFGGGAGTAASSHSWVMIAGHRLGQPSEIAKLTTVLMLARVLAVFREPPRSLVELWKPMLVVLVPLALIMAQPDLGSGLVFIGIFFSMLFWTGLEWRLLLLLASPGISLVLAFSTGLWGAWFAFLLVVIFWYRPYLWESVTIVLSNVALGVVAPKLWDRLQPYQQHRLLTFLDPSIDPRRTGWHVLQSKVAIGSGGWVGKGYLAGTQKRLAFLPEQHTDFIFAAFGLASVWVVHIIVNVGMTLNLMPITGIPLPFFSYGGSFMLSCWLSIGLLARIASEGRGAQS